MNLSKNRIKTLLKNKNKIQSRKRYKKKNKKYKKNSFRRKNVNIRKKSLKKFKIKRIAKKKRKAYIKQKGGFKKINWYEIKKSDIDNIQKEIPNEKSGVEEDYDAYSFDFLLEPFFSSRESLMKEFKNNVDGLPPGAGFDEDEAKTHGASDSPDDEKSSDDPTNPEHDKSGEMERNTNKYLKNIDGCTPETVIHVGDGSPGSRRSFLFQNNPNGCNPQHSIEALWKNLFDMGI